MDIPQLGFGTYKIPPANAYQAVRDALEVGYRHIDTAQMYGNEAEVGQAIADSGIDREAIFITTKLNNPYHEPDAARETFAKSLEKLQLDEVDLFLIHWPMAKTTDYVATWRTLLEFAADGRARAVGVSNFEPKHLNRIIDATGVVPAVNQIELHPYLQQRELVAVNQQLGIVTESWSPLARGKIIKDPLIRSIGDEISRTPAQVVIRWHLQHGYVVFPKSLHRERMVENFNVFDFELSPEQMERIDSLECNGRVGSHPDQMELS